MSKWAKVGAWLKDNGGKGAALVGSLITGNVQGAVAAGISLVASATGQSEPDEALRALQTDPAAMIRLRELANQENASIRDHIRQMAQVDLDEFREQQTTIRSGDNATDEYVRRTRPLMARQSWYGTLAYVVVTEVLAAFGHGDGADLFLGGLILAPAGAYLGFRTVDKAADAWARIRGK